MTIAQFLNSLRENGLDENITVKTLIEIIEAQKSLCDNFWYEQTERHARTIIKEICDWEVEPASAGAQRSAGLPLLGNL